MLLMLENNHYRWTFFHLLCRCPYERPTNCCPLNETRKATVLDNYIYATKTASDEEIDKALDYHSNCMNNRRRENICVE